MKRHAQLVQAIQRIWSGKGLISTLLLPLSWLVRLVVSRKAGRYRKQPDLVWHSPLPVVVVGNIYVGGTGKTPVVMALVSAMQERGWRPGVISRGYGVRVGAVARTGQGEVDPGQFGDEPALIARAAGVPVGVHPSRVLAARALIRDYPCVDLIVADDGLQHLALGRDAEIIVQDTRGIGNGRLLPAGPLREPACRLMTADVVVTNTQQDPTGRSRKTAAMAPTAAGRHAAPEREQGHRRAPLHVSMSLVPHDVVHVRSGDIQPWSGWLKNHADTTLGAVAAIGHPERFFSMLRDAGLTLDQVLGLPDHTAFTASTFDTIRAQTILITTKDAIKCQALDDDRLWAVRVTPEFSTTQWIDSLHATLINAARNKSPDCVSAPALN